MRWIAAAFLIGSLAFAMPAQAACWTHSYVIRGRVMVCTTCCNIPGECTTTCN